MAFPPRHCWFAIIRQTLAALSSWCSHGHKTGNPGQEWTHYPGVFMSIQCVNSPQLTGLNLA